MSEIPEKETEKETSFEQKSAQIEQNKSLKQRSFWQKTLRFISKYTFLTFAKTLEYFLNRARFGLMAVCTFNIALIAFVFSEWFIYTAFFTQILPNIFRDLLQTL